MPKRKSLNEGPSESEGQHELGVSAGHPLTASMKGPPKVKGNANVGYAQGAP